MQFDLNYFILLWIVRHGGEWPDWGDPHGQVFIGVLIDKIATQIRDQEVRTKLHGIAAEVIRSQAGKMVQK